MKRAWKTIGATVAIAGLLVTATGPANAAPTHSSQETVSPASTPKEDQEAAEQAALEYLIAGRDRAQKNFEEAVALAKRVVSQADAKKKAAASAYASNGTMTNFRRMTQSNAAYTQAVALGKAMEQSAAFQLRIEKRAVETIAEFMVYPANAAVFLAAWEVVPVCAVPYLDAVEFRVSTAIDALESLPVETRTSFESRIRSYQVTMTALYKNEISARIAYEQARRNYKARPTAANKAAMDYAKTEMEGWIRVVAYDVNDAKISFSTANKGIFDSGTNAISTLISDERKQARVDGEALEACVAKN